jgi:hypothetical protein
MLVWVSTGVKSRYRLEKLDFANVNVGVFGNGSASPAPFFAAEWVAASPLNVPNRLSATIMAQRSAAQ